GPEKFRCMFEGYRTKTGKILKFIIKIFLNHLVFTIVKKVFCLQQVFLNFISEILFFRKNFSKLIQVLMHHKRIFIIRKKYRIQGIKLIENKRIRYFTIFEKLFEFITHAKKGRTNVEGKS